MTATTPHSTAPATAEHGVTRLPLLFAGLLLTSLMSMLDQSITTTAGPAIIADIGGLSSYSWVFIAYMLSFSVAMPLWGKFGDLYGRRRMYLIAISVFLAGSVACGFAVTIGQLIAFRFVQGAGGGAFMVLSMALIGDLFSPRERAKYQGLFAALFAVANLAGPVVGGFVSDTFGWRWVFLVNLPFGITALTLLAVVLPKRLPTRRPTIDVAGAITVALGVSCLVLFTSWGGSRYSWTHPITLTLAAAALISLTAFVFIERRAEEPIVPLHLFSQAQFRSAVVIALAGSFAFFGCINFIPLFFELVAGTSGTATGLLFVPSMIAMAAASLLAGQRISITAHYKVFPVASMSVAIVGAALLATVGSGTPTLLVAGYLAIVGFGIGLSQQVVTLIGQSQAERKDMGVATSTIGFMRNSGVWLGTAVLGGVVNSRFTRSLETYAGTAPLPNVSKLAPGEIAILEPQVRAAVSGAYATALSGAFALTLPVLAIGLVAALLLKNVPLPSRGGPGAGGPGAGGPGAGVGSRPAVERASSR